MTFKFIDVPGPPRDLVGYGAQPPKVRWPGGARVAVNIVVNYEEGSEYSYPAGDGRTSTTGERNTTRFRRISGISPRSPSMSTAVGQVSGGC